jgi:gamma-resorcylate decarboxylase
MMQKKIGLEEHVFLPSFGAYGADASALDGATKAHNYDPNYFADVQKRLGDATLRLEDMDRCGIERIVLSLTQPGIQGIPDRAIAVDTAKRMNDDLAEQFLAAHPNRFAGFAAVALQDVPAACDELERAVSKLDFKGAMINGYSNIGDMDTAQYLDEPPVWDFWARVDALLDVSIYLHPRRPLPNQRRVYESYPILADAPWGFGAETAAHTLRLMLSGLFDRFPRLKIILGHQGEGLPFLLPRIESRLRPCQPAARRTSRGRAQSGRHRGRFAHLYAFSGAADQRKSPAKRRAGPACLGTQGTAFLLVAQGNTGFFRVAQSKTPLPAQAKKSPAEAGQGLVSLEMRKGAASASGQCAWEQSVPETSKGKAPAADGASFLPRPQILDCGSAAAFRLQPQSGSAGIVPIESPPRSGARLLGCGRESARRSNNSWRGGGPFQ